MRAIWAVVFALMLLAAGPAAPAAGQTPESKPLSDYFPSDTIVYIECPSVAAASDGVKGTGLYGLWNDDETKPLRQSVEAQFESTAHTGSLSAFGDFAGTLKGGLAVGVIGSQGKIDWLAVAEVGQDTAAARAFLDKIYADESKSGYPSKEITLSGVNVTVSGVDQECSAITAGVLLVGTRGAMENALSRVAADSYETSLTNSVNFTKALSFVSQHPAYRAVVDLAGVLAACKLPPPGKGDKDYVSDIETISLEGNFRLNGVVEKVLVSTKSADSPLIALLGRSEFDESRFALAPRSALFCAGSAGDPGTSMAPAYGVGMGMRGFVSQLEARSGVSIERDILPCLGTQSLGYFALSDNAQGGAPLGGLDFVTLVEAKDEVRLSKAIDTLAECAKQNPDLLAPGPGKSFPAQLSMETATLGTLKIHYLSAKGGGSFSPAVAVYGGYLIWANNKDAVKSAVDTIIAPGQSILDSEDYKRVRSMLAKQAVQVAYLSLDRIIDVFSGVFAAQGSGDIAKALPFKVDSVPSAATLKRYVDGIGMSASTSGNLLEVDVYSPTGLAPLATAALLGAASEAGLKAPRQAAAVKPSGVPRERLAQIGRMLQIATIERKGKFPDGITDAVPAEFLQSPQDPGADSPVDYCYVKGLTTASPGRRILVCEREGLNGDGRNVLYVDGSVEFLPEKDFQAAMEKQK